MRRILTILTCFLLLTLHSQGQTVRNITPSSTTDRIIKLYPNPATTQVTFDLQKNYEKGLSIQVYSFLGKKMYEGQNIPPLFSLNLSEFNRGLYMYHLIDQGGKVLESGKFQVTR